MYSDNEASLVIERLNQLLKTDSDKKLAVTIGVSPSSISAWRQRNSTPYDICLRIAKEKGIDLNWLLTGEGEMYKNIPQCQEGEFDPQTLAIARMVKVLDPVEKNGVESFVSDKKFIHEMKRRDMRQSA